MLASLANISKKHVVATDLSVDEAPQVVLDAFALRIK